MPIETVPPPPALCRVARTDGATRFSRISPADNRSAKAGNRYDVVGGGVLYGADLVETCFRETLARLRPTPRMRQLLQEADPDEPGFMMCGGVPQTGVYNAGSSPFPSRTRFPSWTSRTRPRCKHWRRS